MESLLLWVAFKPLNKTVAEVKRMRVHPSLHGKGLGKWLLKTIEHKMRKKGYLQSKVNTLNAQGSSSSGYQEVSRSPTLGVESGFKVVTFTKML